MKPTIYYPTKLSEFEIHAQLYSMLREGGIDARGCVPARCLEPDHRTPKTYLDIVVFSELRTPIVIVECKNRAEDSPNPGKLGTRQLRRYSSFDIPLLICDRESMIRPIYEQVSALCFDYAGT